MGKGTIMQNEKKSSVFNPSKQGYCRITVLLNHQSATNPPKENSST